MRFGRALLVAALAMTFSSVRAGPAEDAQGLLRRDSDQFLWYTWQEHDFGHNHFWISLTDHREGFPVARSPGINAELRATVTWLDAATGEIRERRFSSFAREGYEVFTEGPL